MTIEIVDFPIENGGSFHSYVNVYQRVSYIIYRIFCQPTKAINSSLHSASGLMAAFFWESF